MEARSKLTPEELKIIDELVDKSLNRKKIMRYPTRKPNALPPKKNNSKVF